MTFELAIVAVSERGVQVRVGDGPSFWLPRSAPGIEWSPAPEADIVAFARLPRWLVSKHRALAELQYQRAFSLQSPIDTTTKDGELPMADALTGRGALFRQTDKKSDKAPDYRGDVTITLPDGRDVKLELAGWIKEGARGKFLSLALKPPRDQQQNEPQRAAPQPQQNTYAAARGRDDRQHQPGGGPSFDDDSVPF